MRSRRRHISSHKPLGNSTVAFNASQGTARRMEDTNGVATYVADGRIVQEVMKRQRQRARDAMLANAQKLLEIKL